MKLFIICFISLFILSGCNTMKYYTKKQKAAYICSIVASSADMITTEIVLAQGGRELNPYLEHRGFRIGSQIAYHVIGGKIETKYITPFFGTSCLIQSIYVMHNFGEIR